MMTVIVASSWTLFTHYLSRTSNSDAWRETDPHPLLSTRLLWAGQSLDRVSESRPQDGIAKATGFGTKGSAWDL